MGSLPIPLFPHILWKVLSSHQSKWNCSFYCLRCQREVYICAQGCYRSQTSSTSFSEKEESAHDEEEHGQTRHQRNAIKLYYLSHSIGRVYWTVPTKLLLDHRISVQFRRLCVYMGWKWSWLAFSKILYTTNFTVKKCSKRVQSGQFI